MKEELLLLLVAIIVATLSWAFWRFLADDAMAVLSSLILVSLLVDNIRLRRKMRSLQKQ